LIHEALAHKFAYSVSLVGMARAVEVGVVQEADRSAVREPQLAPLVEGSVRGPALVGSRDDAEQQLGACIDDWG
jgi:hypothetical protein